jgi:hypothetical protein
MYIDSQLHPRYKTSLLFWEQADFPTMVQNEKESIMLENLRVNRTKAALF